MNKKDREEVAFSMGMTEKQLYGGKKWIREHKGTPVAETPLWVLISLGVMAVEEDKA